MRFKNFTHFLSIVESGFYSISNLVIGVYFLYAKNYNAGYLYSCGLSLGLLSVAFIRNQFLIEFSMGKKYFRDCVKGALAPFFFTNIFGLLFIYLFYEEEGARGGLAFVFIISLYFYCHEILRYLISGRLKYIVNLVPLFLFFISVFFIVNNQLGMVELFLSMVSLLIVEFFILCFFYKKSDGSEANFFESFCSENLKIVLASSSLIHFPFLFSGFFGGAEVASKLFTLRSMFQGVQVVLRAFELKIIDFFRRIDDSRDLIKGLAFSTTLSLVVGISSVCVYYVVAHLFLSKSFPFGVKELVCWLVIFVCISNTRILELISIKMGQRFTVYRAYGIGGIIAFFGILYSSSFYNVVVIQSFVLSVAWFVVFLYMISFRLVYGICK